MKRNNREHSSLIKNVLIASYIMTIFPMKMMLTHKAYGNILNVKHLKIIIIYVSRLTYYYSKMYLKDIERRLWNTIN